MHLLSEPLAHKDPSVWAPEGQRDVLYTHPHTTSSLLENQEASPAFCPCLAGGYESRLQSWELGSSSTQNKQNFFLQLEGEAQS